MTNDPNQLSISAVHRLTGKARSTITKHMDNGELSFTLDSKGRRVIEASEVARVYGVKFDLDDEGKLILDTKRPEKPSNDQPTSDARLFTEMENHRKSLEGTIANLRDSLEKSQARESQKLLLLTDQSSNVEKINEAVSKELRELRESLAAQELETKKLKRRLLAERNMSWLDRMFGRRRGQASG